MSKQSFFFSEQLLLLSVLPIYWSVLTKMNVFLFVAQAVNGWLKMKSKTAYSKVFGPLRDVIQFLNKCVVHSFFKSYSVLYKTWTNHHHHHRHHQQLSHYLITFRLLLMNEKTCKPTKITWLLVLCTLKIYYVCMCMCVCVLCTFKST